jgi:hydrogenase assembly chaperone HypC/HupF
MCIAFPGRVVAVDAAGAVVDQNGRLRRASTLYVPELEAGDWVMVAVGTVLRRIAAEEAAEIRTLLETAQQPQPSEGEIDVQPIL